MFSKHFARRERERERKKETQKVRTRPGLPSATFSYDARQGICRGSALMEQESIQLGEYKCLTILLMKSTCNIFSF